MCSILNMHNSIHKDALEESFISIYHIQLSETLFIFINFKHQTNFSNEDTQ